jgi:hypothetical protein
MPPKKLTHKEKLDNAWKRIKPNLSYQSDDSGIVRCREVSVGPGVVKNKHADTFKVSFGKDKKLVHRVAYEHYHDTIDDTLDVSHLCGNSKCCKKSHLCEEDHQTNMARIGCPGWLKHGDKDQFLKVCQHHPPCIKVTVIDSLTRTQELTEKDMIE